MMLLKFLLLLVLCTWTSSYVSGEAGELDAKTLRKLGDDAMLGGKSPEAIGYFTQLIGVDPSNKIGYYKRASVYLRQRKYREAYPDLTRALEKDPDFLKALSNRSIVLMRLGRCEEAKADLLRIQKLDPTNKKLKKELPRATECAVAIRRIKEEYALLDAEEAPEANHMVASAVLPLITKALTKASASLELMVMENTCHMYMHNYHDILLNSRAGLKMDPKNMELLELRGTAYYKLGDHDVAINHFKQGLKLAPEHKSMKMKYKKVKKLVKLVKAADAAVKKSQWAIASGKFKAALAVDAELIEYNADLNFKLCDAYAKAKKGQEAVDACNAFLKVRAHVSAVHTHTHTPRV